MLFLFWKCQCSQSGLKTITYIESRANYIINVSHLRRACPLNLYAIYAKIGIQFCIYSDHFSVNQVFWTTLRLFYQWQIIS
jgi:hypothetical protein